MSEPVLSTSSPLNGATGVARNSSISLVFAAALDPNTMDAPSFYLRNDELNERVEATISYSSDNKTFYLTPATLLIPNSAYKIVVIGTDISSEDAVEGDDGTPLTATIEIGFQTGETIVGSQNPAVGDLVFPEQITVSGAASSPLQPVSARPAQHKFGIPIDTETIAIRFNKDIDPDTLDGNVEITQEAFYGEEDLLGVEADLGDGLLTYFKREIGTVDGIEEADFEDIEGEFEASGEYLIWRRTDTRNFLKNMSVQITISSDLGSTDGDTLGESFIWFGCTEPFPDWTSILAVRHELGHEVTNEVPEYFVGLRAWSTATRLLVESEYVIDPSDPGPYFKRFAKLQAAMDVWDDLKAAASLAAGISKRLGDLEISYVATAGAVRSRRIGWLEDELKKLQRQIDGWYTQKPHHGVKSYRDIFEPDRAFFRNRLWKAELAYNAVLVPEDVANTAAERFQSNYETDFNKEL